MPTNLSASRSVDTIDRFIQEVTSVEKRAETAHTEAGSIGGETEHPVKNVDDRTEVAQEGARSTENAKDVKEDQGAPGVESTPEAKAAFDLSRFAKPIPGRVKKAEGGAVSTPGSAADDHLQIGTKVEATGDDPASETSSAKAGKEDPGSSHPARTDNDALDGHKYSADQLAEMPLEKLAAIVSDMGNDICASLAIQEPGAQFKQAADLSDAQVAHQAGWELAGLVSGNFDKQAADVMVGETLAEMIKTAEDDADNVGTYLDNYYASAVSAQYEKTAEGDMLADPSMAGAPPGEDPMAGGGMPPDAGGGMPPGGEEEMLAALGEGDAGGLPDEGGEPGADDETMQLAQILEDLGVTPEELEQAMQAEGGGDGELPMGGEEAPKEAADRQKTAGIKRGNTRDGVREYIQEVIARSRRPGR